MVPSRAEPTERAVAMLDDGQIEEARALASGALEDATAGLGDDWLTVDVTALLRRLRDREHGRALARALWVTSAIDEIDGRIERAHQRCLRAIELYARLRLEIGELDVRAARELGSASARLAVSRR